MSCSDGDYAWRHAVGIGNWTSAPSGRLLVMWSTSVTHEWCITWDYCPCLLSQQLWLIFERKKKMVHVLHVGGGIWDCNSYVPTSLTCRLLQEIGSHLSRR